MRTKDEAKERLILDTALAMITRTGLAGLKMSDLAREAGLATGTVYIYFKDKEELIQRLYLFLTRKMTFDLAGTLPETASLREKTHHLAWAYLRSALDHPEYDAFFEQYYRSPWCNPESVGGEEHALLAPIYALVQQGQEAGLLKPGNPDLLVSMVCGAINEVARQSLYTGTPVTPETWQTVLNFIWDGLKQ